MTKLKIDISDKISIIGYSGSGKSSLLKYLIKNISYPMIIIDTTNQFTQRVNIRYLGKLKPLKDFDFKNKSYYKIQTDNDLEQIITKVNDNYNKPVLVVIDEIDQFIDVHNVLTETSLYLQQGRNYAHGGIFTVRQVGRLNKEILSNSKFLFLFKIYNKSDIDYISSVIGYPVSELIKNLEQHDFYIIDLQNTQIIGKFILVKDKLIQEN